MGKNKVDFLDAKAGLKKQITFPKFRDSRPRYKPVQLDAGGDCSVF